MAQIDGMLMELDSLTENANKVKDIVLERLLYDKIITAEQLDEYSEKWQMIVIKSNWFKKWMNKYSKNEERYFYKFVRFQE